MDYSADTSWYDRPIKERTALMISPFKLGEHIITTFAAPIIYDGKAIGVISKVLVPKGLVSTASHGKKNPQRINTAIDCGASLQERCLRKRTRS